MSSSEVSQKLITPSSSSGHDSGTSPDALDIMSTPIQESANPPAQNHVFTFKCASAAEVSTPRISPLPCVCGPFRVWRTLSKGGFAMAMGAEDIASNRLICLKVFRKDRLRHNSTKEDLLNELEVYKRLASSRAHPASIFLMELELSFQTKDAICFAMDLMACDLNTCMRDRSVYCSKNAGRWTVQLAHGINALHEMGIIHCDIKPKNILIDIRQNLRITDFGLSYLHEGPLEPQRAYTADFVGTDGYRAPEILSNKDCPGFRKYGAPVDWWALGCVVFELVSEGHQVLFDREEDLQDYIFWRCRLHRGCSDFPAFKGLPKKMVNLMAGLLDPVSSERYGFQKVADHLSFFVDPYSRALRRQEKPGMLPDLRCGQDPWTAEIWDRLPSSEYPRVANVDWIKPPCFSFS